MNASIITSLIGMAIAASWTPGPNNSMLASSGATYGIRASIPHVLGIILGFPLMIFLVGLGLGEVFRSHPVMHQVLRYAGAAMMLWIAWKIANAAPPGQPGKTSRPLSFVQAAGFQWINPKGWMAAIAVTTQFVTVDHPVRTSLIVAGVFVLAGLSSTMAWLVFGQVVGRFLNSPAKLKIFNYSMALMLIGFLILLLIKRHN